MGCVLVGTGNQSLRPDTGCGAVIAFVLASRLIKSGRSFRRSEAVAPARTITRELLLEDARICIAEALRGCLCCGCVDGIAVRRRRGASATRLRGS